MPKFLYTAIDTDGETLTGVRAAPSLTDVYASLRASELHPLEVKPKRSILQFEITKEKVKRKDLMHFSRQLAVFVRSGIPILEALEVIGEETTSKVLKNILVEMGDALRGGMPFAEAAAVHTTAFPDFYVSILRSAELTGHLDLVLEQLADYIERDLDARSKITSAMVYPAIVFAMAIVTTLVLTIFVLPRFEDFFDSLNAELPLATRMLLAVSGFMGSWGWLVTLSLVATVGGSVLFFKTRAGRPIFDRLLLGTPALGDLVRHAILERFCRVLASMVGAGVPLPDAMAVTGDVANNAVYKRGIDEARQAMLRGEGLAGPLSATGLFPGAARQMFRVGEDTGTLEEQMRAAAAYFDRELELKIKRFTALFEPMVIIFMGVVVGFVAVAMVSAMYGIFNQTEGF